VIKFVSDLPPVGSFLRELLFPPSIKLMTVSTVSVELVIVVMSEPVTASTRYMYKIYEKVWL
jgi:hypothetical protein